MKVELLIITGAFATIAPVPEAVSVTLEKVLREVSRVNVAELNVIEVLLKLQL